MIGEKIRRIRKEKNLTIIELADQVSVTPGYISQIERDLIDPSISVLRRLSMVLGISLSTLFLEEKGTEIVHVTKEKRTKIKFGDLDLVYEVLTPKVKNNEKVPNIQVVYFKLKPGSWGCSEIMLNRADDCVYVLKGILEYRVDNEIYIVKEGEAMYTPENHGYLLHNPTNEDTELLGIASPAVM